MFTRPATFLPGFSCIVFGLFHAAIAPAQSTAPSDANLSGQSAVRAYADPGHRWLGVYAGGPDRYFDYFLRKLSLADTFPDKAAWWAELKNSRAARDDAHRHDVFILYCGEKQGDPAAAKRRIDAWLKAERDCPTYPELIPAICLGEENIPSQNPVLQSLAEHLREHYRIPVLQWYSDPVAPSLDLTADGWIWDSYGWDQVRFRKHAMKFAVLRKPAICVPWATDPHWPQWTRYPTAAALIDREWRQFDVCREFNISCAVFAVAGPHGSVNTWAGSSAPELVTLRNALLTQRTAMHAIVAGELPSTSADFSARDAAVQVGGDSESPSDYHETFSGFDWLHAADVRGFLNLRLTGRPDQPGFLELMPRSNGPAQASLVYRFESYFPLQSVEATLDASTRGGAGAQNRLAITIDEPDSGWPLEVVQRDANAVAPLTLRDQEHVRGRHVFYLRVLMENPHGEKEVAVNRLDGLRVRCVHQTPPRGTAGRLAIDDNDAMFYEDDFRTNRWKHLGDVKAEHPSHGGFRDGYFWVGLKGGTATATRIVQRMSAPRPLSELAVMADCYADAPNLGGSITLSIASRDGQPRWQAMTQGRHDGILTLNVPVEQLEGLRDFDVHVQLSSGSGVEQGDKACAILRRLRIEAK